MKKLILTYGILAGLINGLVAWILTSFFSNDLAHANAEWVGYLVMMIALSLIFFGIKKYRDEYQGGVIKFSKAFLIGLAIAGTASVAYVATWEVYIYSSSNTFMEDYSESYLEMLKAEDATEEEIQAAEEQMAWYKEMYEKPLLRMLITLSEIFPVGLIISLISAGLLKNTKILPE